MLKVFLPWEFYDGCIARYSLHHVIRQVCYSFGPKEMPWYAYLSPGGRSPNFHSRKEIRTYVDADLQKQGYYLL